MRLDRTISSKISSNEQLGGLTFSLRHSKARIWGSKNSISKLEKLEKLDWVVKCAETKAPKKLDKLEKLDWYFWGPRSELRDGHESCSICGVPLVHEPFLLLPEPTLVLESCIVSPNSCT